MTNTLIDYYKAIENTSVQMLTAARMENWDEVVRLEGACAVLIEQLRHESRSQVLSADQRAEKNRIMLSILRHDAQIRSLAEPWLTSMEDMMPTHMPSLTLH
ncbi:MAG: flagellar protein FliT [Hydrogenophaga sp.]|nr:flagellar protein FliT [Hydrogenophaga sp.]